jgi:hypothetical protein
MSQYETFKGILSDPNPRKSRTIDEEVVNLVTAFLSIRRHQQNNAWEKGLCKRYGGWREETSAKAASAL